jgi:hypothetical protein
MIVFRGLLRAALIITVFFSSSCFFPGDPVLTIQISNQTEQTLEVCNEGESFVGKVASAGEIKFQIDAIFLHYSVVAKDMQGNIVYTANFTKEGIAGKRTYRIVIPGSGNGNEKSDNTTQ